MEIPRKHSGFGIASFILAVISIAGVIGSMIAASTMAASFVAETGTLAPGELPAVDEGAIGGMLATVGLVFLFIIAALVGAVLGIVGLFQKDRLKLFSVLGLTFNSLLVFGFLLLFLAITLMGPALPGVAL